MRWAGAWGGRSAAHRDPEGPALWGVLRTSEIWLRLPLLPCHQLHHLFCWRWWWWCVCVYGVVPQEPQAPRGEPAVGRAGSWTQGGEQKSQGWTWL